MKEPSNPIRVVIADDHELTRAGMRKLLAAAPDITIVGEAEDGDVARRLVSDLHPHVLLLDLVMRGPSPVETTLWAEQQQPPTHVLVLTAHDHEYFLAQMAEAGAMGYLDKGVRAQQLIGCIRSAALGESHFTLKQLKRIQIWRTEVWKVWESFTPREVEILKFLSQGRSNAQIAEELSVSERTVETHIGNLLKKIGVSSRTEAIAWNIRNGIPEIWEGDWWKTHR